MALADTSPRAPAPTPRVPWDEFEDAFAWRQSEHISLIGPTGCGKTTLTNRLIDFRKYEVFLGSKRIDETQEELHNMGFLATSDPDIINHQISRRWYARPKFNPKLSSEEEEEVHREFFRRVLKRVYDETAWTTFIDEGRYICDYLGLRKDVIRLLTQGRSQNNSVVIGAQRPRYVPLEVYDQATHLFFWKDPDLQNVQRVAEMAGVNKRHAAMMVGQLEYHEFLYYNTRTGESLISKVDV